MIKQGHLGMVEAVGVAATLVATNFFYIPRPATEHAATAGWMIVPLNALEAIFIVWLYLDVFDQNHPGGLVEQFERQTGLVGTLACLLLTLNYFGIAGLSLRRFAGEALTSVLPRTPITAIEAGMLLGLAYGAYSGLETLARVVMLLALPLAATFVSLLAFAWRRFNPTHLLPLFGYGFKPLLYWGAFAGWFRELGIVMVIWPYLRQRTQAMRIAWASVGLAAPLMALAVISVLMFFPFPTAPRFPFPILEITRGIRIGAFLSNAEAVYVFLFTLGILLKLALTFWIVVTLTADLLHLSEYRPLIPVLALGLWMLAYVPPNLADAGKWSEVYIRGFGSYALYPVNLLVWGIARIKGRRRGASA